MGCILGAWGFAGMWILKMYILEMEALLCSWFATTEHKIVIRGHRLLSNQCVFFCACSTRWTLLGTSTTTGQRCGGLPTGPSPPTATGRRWVCPHPIHLHMAGGHFCWVPGAQTLDGDALLPSMCHQCKACVLQDATGNVKYIFKKWLKEAG